LLVDGQAALPGVAGDYLTWSDYDSDGQVDLLLRVSSGPSLFRNIGSGSFAEVSPSPLQTLFVGSAAWADFNNDGRIDLAVSGTNPNLQNTREVRLLRSNASVVDSVPSAPAGLRATLTSGRVTLDWDSANDPNQSGGLNYNVRVGRVPDGSGILSAMADSATGFRRLPARGNAGERLYHYLAGLAPGTYYWSVQAIDHSFLGSPFAAESSFTVPPVDGELRISAVQLLAGVDLHLTLNGPAERRLVVEHSGDLRDWTAAVTNQLVGGATTYSEPSGEISHRYFRARLLP
jgi:hypothetical protein